MSDMTDPWSLLACQKALSDSGGSDTWKIHLCPRLPFLIATTIP
jgi:hypothetical protein